MSDHPFDLKTQIVDRIRAAPDAVWTPVDFLDLGSREAVDKTLQRLTFASQIRRLDRGLYDRPQRNRLTGQMSVPDYRRVIQAVARRDQTRMLVDGMTAANDLGLSDAVPGRIVVHTDARLRPIKLGKQVIAFRPTAPSKLFWADRPAMRVVQALHWLRDSLADPDDRRRILRRLRSILADKDQGPAIASDLARACQRCQPGCRTWCANCLSMMLTTISTSMMSPSFVAAVFVGASRRPRRRGPSPATTSAESRRVPA